MCLDVDLWCRETVMERRGERKKEREGGGKEMRRRREREREQCYAKEI